jgi:hypothetical protein
LEEVKAAYLDWAGLEKGRKSSSNWFKRFVSFVHKGQSLSQIANAKLKAGLHLTTVAISSIQPVVILKGFFEASFVITILSLVNNSTFQTLI